MDKEAVVHPASSTFEMKPRICSAITLAGASQASTYFTQVLLVSPMEEARFMLAPEPPAQSTPGVLYMYIACTAVMHKSYT